jgi:hypothetical protein
LPSGWPPPSPATPNTCASGSGGVRCTTAGQRACGREHVEAGLPPGDAGVGPRRAPTPAHHHVHLQKSEQRTATHDSKLSSTSHE